MIESAIEFQLAQHCAPAMVGVKPANLLSLYRNEYPDLEQQLTQYESNLAQRGIRFFVLYRDAQRLLLFVYREACLADYLGQRAVQSLLSEYGYLPDLSLLQMIERLAQKMQYNRQFPHEIGLFLGYPPEDVQGFIQNYGKKEKLCGYWKVYGDPMAASRRFALFDRVCHAVLSRLQNGRTLLEVFSAA